MNTHTHTQTHTNTHTHTIAGRQPFRKKRVRERDRPSRDSAFGQWLNRGICEAAHVHPLCMCMSECVCVFVCVYMATAAAPSASPQGRFHLHLLQFCCISVSAGVAALMLLLLLPLLQGDGWAASVVNGRGRGQLAKMARQRGISNCQAPSRLGSCTWRTHTQNTLTPIQQLPHTDTHCRIPSHSYCTKGSLIEPFECELANNDIEQKSQAWQIMRAACGM